MAKRVFGVNSRAVDAVVMAESLEALGEDYTGTIPQKIERLARYFYTFFCGSNNQVDFYEWLDDENNKQKVCICDPGCGGISPVYLDRCPYCGDKAEIDMEKLKEPEIIETEGVEILPENALDDNVAKITGLKINMCDNYYDLGRLLKENDEKELWKLRPGNSGPKYRNFSDWCRAEVNLGRTQVWKCISVYENFDRKQVRKIGHTKLAVALQVPVEAREKLLDKAENGASKRELEATAAELTGKPTAKSDRLSMAVDLVVKELPLLASNGEPAQEIEDEPYCEEELSNGVIQKFFVCRDDIGTLVLRIERARE